MEETPLNLWKQIQALPLSFKKGQAFSSNAFTFIPVFYLSNAVISYSVTVVRELVARLIKKVL